MATKTVNQQIDALLKRGKNPARKVSPIFAEMKRCYLAGEFPDIQMRPGEGKEVSYYSKDGRFLQWFETRAHAKHEYEKQWKRAEKFIGMNNNPARKTAARSVVLVAAKNPRVNKYAPSHRVESSLDKKSWVHYGDFLGKAKASEVAKLLHESHPDLYIRVVTIK